MLCGSVPVPVPGIVANNASGMCCGVANNTYNTLDNLRIVFVDGTVLDTADKDSCDSFSKVCGDGRADRSVQTKFERSCE